MEHLAVAYEYAEPYLPRMDDNASILNFALNLAAVRLFWCLVCLYCITLYCTALLLNLCLCSWGCYSCCCCVGVLSGFVHLCLCGGIDCKCVSIPSFYIMYHFPSVIGDAYLFSLPCAFACICFCFCICICFFSGFNIVLTSLLNIFVTLGAAKVLRTSKSPIAVSALL